METKLVLVAVLLGSIALTGTLFTVAGTGENQVYLDPQHGNATPCDTATIGIWIDAENYQGGQISLWYDPDCINMTNWARNETIFPLGGWDSSPEGHEWITVLAYAPLTGRYHIGTFTVHARCSGACATDLNFTYPSALFDPNGDEIAVNWLNGTFKSLYQGGFDTGPGTYPSIPGTYNGTIKPNQTLTVSTLYTYPCPGTGGHTASARIWNATLDVTATWNGYGSDWHNLTFSGPFVLYKGEPYNYTIITGSYPEIIPHHSFTTSDGSQITCDKFVDANGKEDADRIPAIRLG